MKNTLILILSSLLASTMTLAAGKATVEVTAKAQSGKKLELTFKTKPADGLVINHDGPWKLDIQNSGSIKPERTEYKRADRKEDTESFVVTAEHSGAKSGDIKFKMITFVCTKDKSQCFREVIDTNAKLSW